MATAPILVAGEALYDLVAGPGGEINGHPGGGPFNLARTIGRLGRRVAYLGRLSTDRLGRTHHRMLADDGVDTSLVVRTDDPTTLALASLDAEGGASYGFYTAGTAAAGLRPEEALAALPPHVAALHVGTLGLVLEPTATALEAVVERLAGTTMIVLDPNCRPQAIDDPEPYRARLDRVLARSDIVKISEEDLAWLRPGSDAGDAARALLEHGPRAVLLTRGPDGVTVITPNEETHVAAEPTTVVDTIGAGDAFGGGFLAWWHSRNLGKDDLSTTALIADAARFGALVAARTVARAGASPPQLRATAKGRPLQHDSV
ncbi:MAG TPA: carbohydrate kinase [Solirubrobacteraceae bacterium]|nr:carbohydrate kinase [Solirubrobacteraceae bacterium]